MSDNLAVYYRHSGDSCVLNCGGQAGVIYDDVKLLVRVESAVGRVHNRRSKTDSKRADLGVLIRLNSDRLRVSRKQEQWRRVSRDACPSIGLCDRVVAVRNLQVHRRR